jgi:hypothetical protein
LVASSGSATLLTTASALNRSSCSADPAHWPTCQDLSGQPAHPFVRVAHNQHRAGPPSSNKRIF